MKINITFRHLDQSDAIKERVREKLAKLDRRFSREVEASVILTAEKHRHGAEIVLTAPGAVFSASTETDDLYAAVDKTVQAISRQVRRHLEKRTDHHTDAREVEELRSTTVTTG